MKFQGKIYILCPAYYVTGGTELLHQLVFKLNHIFHVDAYIYYVDINWKFEVPPTPKRFFKYINDCFVEEIEDNEDNVLVVPENFSNYLFRFSKIRRVLWWLSVDNFFLQFKWHYQTESKTKRLKRRIRKVFNGFPYNRLQRLKDPGVVFLHLVQSQYAYEFLRKYNLGPITWLSDYINPEITSEKNTLSKKDQVIYNPMKGKEFTAKLMAYAPEINWVALQRMSPSEVAARMAESKVYIDFGHHPGKDRIPREAVLNDCIILTNRKGAAGNEVDLPIPYSFKFEESNENIQQIISKIRFCFANYATVKNDFTVYKERIKSEELVFESELKHFLDLL